MNRLSNIRLMLLAAFMLLSFNGYSQNSSLPFQSGEKAKIIIHYKCGTKADIGSVDLSLDQKSDGAGKPYFDLRANIATFKFWDNFYKVRDSYVSNFYVNGLTPVKASRNVNEGDYWARNQYVWSNGGKTLHAIVDKSTRPHRDTTFTESSVIRDLFNVIFTCRAQDINRMMAGKVARYILAMDKDLIDLRLKYVGRENKKLGDFGTFKTIKLAVSVNALHPGQVDATGTKFSVSIDNAATDDNVFHGEGKIFIWLTDDDNHLPVFFTAPVIVGSINGRLASCSGLKYPLSSKIE